MAEKETLAALASQLEGLRARVMTLEAKSDDTGTNMLALTAVKKLRTDFEALEAALTDALSSGKAGKGSAPIFWYELDGDDLTAQMHALEDWVNGVLRPGHPVYVKGIMPCWAEHPEALWELGNLWQEWRRIYANADKRDLDGALTWHDRLLPGALARLSPVMSSCRDGHRTPQRG
jgi:hypothetical protein